MTSSQRRKKSATTAVRNLKAASAQALEASARLKASVELLNSGRASADDEAEMLKIAAEVDATNRAMNLAIREAREALELPKDLK